MPYPKNINDPAVRDRFVAERRATLERFDALCAAGVSGTAASRALGDLAEFARDEIYDHVNLIFHDAAALWQFINQGDVEEALEQLASIRGRCEAIDVTCAAGGLVAASEAPTPAPGATMIGECDWCGAQAVDVIVRDGTPLAYCAVCRAADYPLKEGK